MSLHITQSINLEIKEGRRVVFTTNRDHKVDDSYKDSTSSVEDIRANTGLHKVSFNGIVEAENIYMLSDKPGITFRIVPPGKTVLEAIDMTLVENVPCFLAIKAFELWVANPTSQNATLIVAVIGRDTPSVPITLPPPTLNIGPQREFLADASVGVGDLVYPDPNVANQVLKATDNNSINPVIGIVSDRPNSYTVGVFMDGEYATNLPQGKVYVGADGKMTTTPPATGYLQIVGFSWGSHRMKVRPEIIRSHRAT